MRPNGEPRAFDRANWRRKARVPNWQHAVDEKTPTPTAQPKTGAE